MINKIKWWIFRKLCLGSIPDPTIDSFPCAYCKEYDEDKNECRLCKKLGLEYNI